MSDEKWTELKAQKSLYWWRHNAGHHSILTNVHMLLGEADMVSITGAGFLHEYEIKISRSDFLREFKHKKHKHDTLSGGDPLFHNWHDMRQLDLTHNNSRRERTAEYGVPNYFWLVVPWSLSIAMEEIPEHMGVICLPDLFIARKAPRIHNFKVNAGLYRRLLMKAEARIPAL